MATLKQRAAFKKTLENAGNVSRAMREVGYSPATAKTPSELTNSKGWQELLEKHIPDKLLIKVHKEGLEATKLSNSLTSPDVELPDYPTRHKYLETAYKIKSKLDPEKSSSNQILIIISGQSAARYGATTAHTSTSADRK